MYNVAILMSTYNGEKYISEQIDSIVNQENVSLTLWIRDDGSKDETLNILDNYIRKNNNIHIISGANCGPGNSFMNLLYQIPDNFDFYGFADQDDIWLKNKVYEAVLKIKDIKEPCLYVGNQIIKNDKTNINILRYDRTPIVDYHGIMCQNPYSGCTMVFNKSLFDLIKERKPSEKLLKNRMHDVWVAMVASITGKIVVDDKALIYYRQHEDNVVGIREENFSNILKGIIRKLRDPSIRNGRSMLAKEIYENFPDYINKNNEDIIVYSNYSANIKYKIRLLHDKKIQNNCHEHNFYLFFKILFNLF